MFFKQNFLIIFYFSMKSFFCVFYKFFPRNVFLPHVVVYDFVSDVRLTSAVRDVWRSIWLCIFCFCFSFSLLLHCFCFSFCCCVCVFFVLVSTGFVFVVFLLLRKTGLVKLKWLYFWISKNQLEKNNEFYGNSYTIFKN